MTTGTVSLSAISPARPLAPLWLLALITFSGTLAMHVLVPALPLAAMDLGASTGSMQLTISFYTLGLAFGQLLYGPLSDRFGRRPVLLIGLAIYSAGGVAAALAPTVNALIIARLFQALGGCSGLVLGRAIVRDGADLSQTARRLALMNLMVSTGPGLAPLLGGVLAATTGWRSIFVMLSGLGIANVLLAWRLLPETDAGRLAGGGRMISSYRALMTSRAFLGYAIGGGCATTSMYAFVSAAPFIVVDQLHRSVHEVGMCLAVIVSGMWLGSVLASRLAGRVPIRRMLVAASLLSLVAASALLGLIVSRHLTLVAAIGSMTLFTIGVGIAGPLALAEATSVNPRAVGSASGLYGFIQMSIGALTVALAGAGEDPALAAAIVLVAAGMIGQVAFSIAFRSSPADQEQLVGNSAITPSVAHPDVA